MTDRPIIFSAPMTRALLSGRKTQTRRVLRWQPDAVPGHLSGPYQNAEGVWGQTMQDPAQGEVWCPLRLPAAPGDLLWVKEAHRLPRWAEGPTGVTKYGPVFYEADQHWFLNQTAEPGKKRPSIHMPRWASRLTLVVSDVRVERLNDISEADAKAEGVRLITCLERGRDGFTGTGEDFSDTRQQAFARLWESIHGPEGWAANPWVVVIAFEARRTPIDSLTHAERAAAVAHHCVPSPSQIAGAA